MGVDVEVSIASKAVTHGRRDNSSISYLVHPSIYGDETTCTGREKEKKYFVIFI